MQLIYLLHFDEPLGHARHYLGSTTDLRRRLYDHANGSGARITQVLHEQGLNWQLARLAVKRPRGGTLSELERRLKNQHNGDEFCPICNAEPRMIPSAEDYPISVLNIPTTSEELRKCTR